MAEQLAETSSAAETKSAVAALQRWKRDGVQEVDPHSKDFIEAYLMVRRNTPRVQLTQVLSVINSREQNMRDERAMIEEYQLVPKMNFPKGIPAWLQEFVYTPEEVAESCSDKNKITGDIFIVDRCVETKRLGKGTTKAEFRRSEEFVKKLRLGQAPALEDASSLPALTDGDLSAASTPGAAGSAPATPTSPEAPVTAARKRPLAEAASAPETAASAPAATTSAAPTSAVAGPYTAVSSCIQLCI